MPRSIPSPVRAGVVAATTLMATALAPAAATADADAPDASTARIERLSDERRSSWWAHPARIVPIRAQHRVGARTVARTRLFTELRSPEVYLALARWTSTEGEEWIRIRVPRRPNGVTGWVPADALGPLRRVRTQLMVDRGRRRLTLLDRGRVVLRVPIGIGKVGTPTPAGRFYVREKVRFARTPMYGTRALGTSAYAPTLSDWPGGGVVGLHGTDAPGLIPGRPSHGCVRLRNQDMRRLYARTPIGTPVRIV